MVFMFISLSKTLAKVGGFRLGLGIRMNKRNAPLLWCLTLFVSMFQLMWYLTILCLWLMYAMCYGIYWCIKQIVRKVKQSNSVSEA